MPLIPQNPSSYTVEPTCQIENIGWLLEQLPVPFGIFDPTRKGRIVEVGGFDGKTYSNFWGLILAGWPTLLIEPMPENLIKCRECHKDRPWVFTEQAACSDQEGILQMYFEREGSRNAVADEPRVAVPMTTLNTILKRRNWEPDFDMLVIDVEGYEQPVLRGFDLDYYRPKLAIVETYGFQRQIIHDWFDKLYRLYYADGLNSIFARRDWAA